MGLQVLDIKREYRTKINDVAREFLVPALSEAVAYKRAVGFFSSSALLEIAPGIGRIAAKDGHIQLVASPNLSEEDVAAMAKGYELKDKIIKRRLLEALPQIDSLNALQADRFNLLANLIATGVLDIKIAITESSNGLGIYHNKSAVIEDARGDKIAFIGSMNESRNAMVENYEAIYVFKSWNDPEERVQAEESAFDAIWNGREPSVVSFDFPEIKDEIVSRYLVKSPNYDEDLLGSRNEAIEYHVVSLS